MQIILNTGEVSQAVTDSLKERLLLTDDDVIAVQMNDDGTASVLINEDPEASGNDQPSAGGEKQPRQQKRARRTKAQIEADEAAAAAEAAKNSQAEASTQTGSAETAPAGGNASEQGAEVKDTSSTSLGSEAVNAVGLKVATVEEASPELKAAVQADVVEEAKADPQPEVQVEPEPEVSQEDVQAAQPETKPAGVSLFANLRKPQNA